MPWYVMSNVYPYQQIRGPILLHFEFFKSIESKKCSWFLNGTNSLYLSVWHTIILIIEKF